MTKQPSRETPDKARSDLASGNFLARYPILTFLLPFVVFMVVGSLEPKPPTEEVKASSMFVLGIDYSWYPVIYTIKIALTMLAMVLVLPGYRQFPLRVSPLAIVVGVLGVVAWIGLCELELEQKILTFFGAADLLDFGKRSAFNPFEHLQDKPGAIFGFLAIRFVGLAMVIAVAEEFFLRGFLMRYCVDPDWWNVPFGKVNRIALVLGTAVPMLMHPGELLAAAVWFSGVTWLMVRTRNIWDCVAAHALTNGLLGVYVVVTGEWHYL